MDIPTLFEKLTSVEVISLARSEGIDSQLKKWSKTLLQIQSLLDDAGQKYITQMNFQLWLNDLQDLAYDIDDVLDGLATEAMRRKLNQESNARTNAGTSKVMKIITTSFTGLSSRNKYGHEMRSKIDKITTKLLDLVDKKSSLGLDVYASFEGSNIRGRRLESSLLVDESNIMGREGDKEALLEQLLGNEACNQNLSIVSIVGMGGVGKTTLAKVLYNEEKVKHHFEVRTWVCVSVEFDIFNISNIIFQSVSWENKNFTDLNHLQMALKEKLSNKRFLLVLDDVWNQDYHAWEVLLRPFVFGSPGSKIIVTTRNTKVTSVMESVKAYALDVLSDEEALFLFAQHSLGEMNFDKHPTLKLHAERIVKKCGGLPLALITLGRVLRTKINEDEWEELLNSEVWNLHDERAILPALKLSYYDLPSQLKPLFAYCSLFPKDYLFDKHKLVLLWMAEGFLSRSKGRMSAERSGHEYFEELKSRSFFQHSANDESGYTMPGLINDLATSVAGEFFFRLDDSMDMKGGIESFEKLRHFSFIGQRYGVYRKFKELDRARCLRTFLLESFGTKRWRSMSLSTIQLVELLPQLQFVRVFSLAQCLITEVPQAIGNLKHVRYLNFSHTDITCIPEQVADLYNLQSLLVSHCHVLSSLPISLVKLKNLRHLDITDTPRLKKMPLGIGRLTSLKTLSKAIIEGDNGFQVSELKDLLDLQGRLSIEGLHNVTNARQARDANLQQKKGLDHLELRWSNVFDDSQNETIEYEVLGELTPHDKLRSLKIWFYGGKEFPLWVRNPSFDQLTELKLHGCRSCTQLPTLRHLPSLQKLYVSGMDKVKTVGSEFPAPFPSLEILEFDDMEGWEIWSTSGGDKDGNAIFFPSLREITIISCPKLAQVSIGLIPSLQVLNIEGCSEAVLKTMVGVSSSILTLRVHDIKGLTQLHVEVSKAYQTVAVNRKESVEMPEEVKEAQKKVLEKTKPWNHLKIPLQTIKNCTQDFSETNFIGTGGYGRVYKGILSWADHLDQPVAVKRLHVNGFQGNKEFHTEVRMLSQYRHKNIVTLLGFCDDDKEMILVYEYVSRGSLDTYLRDPAMLRGLSWPQRINICIGVASALNHLHNRVAEKHRIIHCDIKSANVLLDENWNAKLSDFGLSKIGLANQENTFVITGVAGTPGYCDPEFEMTGFLSKESDIYSFGVVLFEVLCGRMACIYNCYDERRFLHHLARTSYQNGEVDKIIDERIRKDIRPRTLSKFSGIAYQCLQKARVERPTVAEVAFQLEEALKFHLENEGDPR